MRSDPDGFAIERDSLDYWAYEYAYKDGRINVKLLGREIDDRRAESLAAVAYGALQGCRIMRVHDVAGTARVCRTIEALL